MVEVWVIHEGCQVLVTDAPGPVAGGSLVISFEEGRDAAWEEALDVARVKAEELGYDVVTETEGEEDFLAELYYCEEEEEDDD